MNATVRMTSIGRPRSVLLFASYEERYAARAIGNALWNKALKCWECSLSDTTFHDLVTHEVSMSPELAAMVQERRECLERAALIKREPPTAYLHPSRMEPLKHQIQGVAYIHAMWGPSGGRCMLLDEMGMGKTKQAIDAASFLLMHGKVNLVMIIAPMSVKSVWRDEICRHAISEHDVIILSGTAIQRAEMLQLARRRPCWLIVNYDQLRHNKEELTRMIEGQALIIDEAHRMKNSSTGWTKIIHEFEPAYALLMTGTPVANKPEDVFSLMDYTSRGIAGRNIYHFYDKYCQKGGYGGKQIIGYKNLNDLRDKLESISLRRLKKDCLNLPPKMYVTRYAQLSGTQESEYARMRDEMVAEYSKMDEETFKLKAKNAVSQLVRLAQICDGFVVRDGSPLWYPEQAKISVLDELLAEIWANNPMDKVIVYSRFVPVCLKLKELYDSEGSEIIYGDTKEDERGEIVRRFQQDDRPRVLFLQIQTGGVGLTLTRARHAIFFDRWWSPSVNSQAEDRIHRIGTTESVNIYSIIAENTTDQYMEKMLTKKIELSEALERESITRESLLSVLKGE